MQVTLDDMNMTGWTDKVYCVQYHEMVYELCGPWLGTVSWIVNVLALLGLAVAQVIACASNMYRLSSNFTKRYDLACSGFSLCSVIVSVQVILCAWVRNTWKCYWRQQAAPAL